SVCVSADGSRIWAVGGDENSFGTRGKRRLILLSKDAGRTWTEQVSNRHTLYDMPSLKFKKIPFHLTLAWKIFYTFPVEYAIRLLKVLYIFYRFIVCLLICLLCHCSKQDRQLQKGWFFQRSELAVKPSELSEKNWKPYQVQTRVPGTEVSRTFWLRIQLPVWNAELSHASQPALFLYDVRELLAVYLDEQKLQTAGHKLVHKDDFKHYALGEWPVIPLPPGFSGKTLYIHAMEERGRPEGILGGVYLGGFRSLQTRFFLTNFDMFILGVFFLLCSFAAFLTGIYRRNVQELRSYFPFIVLTLGAGLTNLSTSDVFWYLSGLEQILIDAQSYCYILMFLGMLLFVEQIFGSGYKALVRRAWQFLFFYCIIRLSFRLEGSFFEAAILIPLFLGIIVFILLRAFQGDREAKVLSFAMGFSFAFFLHDMLIAMRILPYRVYITHWGILFLVLTLVYIIAHRFFQAQDDLRQHAGELERTNNSFARFVPREFLEFLGKQNIVDVQLGDQTQLVMNVLFSDIRSFTSLSENMTPSENFAFLNEYLSRVGPVVRKHGGFIDKYIGDAIMALFPAEADQAVSAALEMRVELAHFNGERKKNKLPPLEIGIGIHRGRLMLGTIGEKERLEGTVISDAVNLASRLEGLTKEKAVAIVISEQLKKNLQYPEKFAIESLGETKVKGKELAIAIYSVQDTLLSR
ncbi:MAG: adenylate/guanylate cyclase domain-containing protein, partial [Spirochaetota bacterium]